MTRNAPLALFLGSSLFVTVLTPMTGCTTDDDAVAGDDDHDGGGAGEDEDQDEDGGSDGEVPDGGGLTGTGQTYGPDGSEWPSHTPLPDAPADAVLASIPALVAALRDAPSGAVFELADGDYGDVAIQDGAAIAHLAGLAENVLVRAEHPGGARFVELETWLPRVTWSYLEVETRLYAKPGADRSRFARIKLARNATTFVLDAHQVEMVGLVKEERGINGDVMQIKATAEPPEDLKIVRCWLESNDVQGSGPHVDTIQWTACAGTHELVHSFLGTAANNNAMQIGSENQGGTPYCAMVLDHVYSGGGGGANRMGPSRGAFTVRDSEIERAHFGDVHWPAGHEWTMSDTRFGNDPAYPDGRSLEGDFPSCEVGAALTQPAFVPPPWWW